MAQAIDFHRHWLRRERRRLAQQLAGLAEQSVCWRLVGGAEEFLRSNGLSLQDLQQVLATAMRADPTGAPKEVVIYGYTVDEVMVGIFVRICTGEEDQGPALECSGGRLFTDEEDLVG